MPKSQQLWEAYNDLKHKKTRKEECQEKKRRSYRWQDNKSIGYRKRKKTTSLKGGFSIPHQISG